MPYCQFEGRVVLRSRSRMKICEYLNFALYKPLEMSRIIFVFIGAGAGSRICSK
jgi:hypothetical protein